MENRNLDIIEILEKVCKERGLDFRQYKKTSLERRLQKRLHALNLKSYEDYIVRLSEDPAEYDRLIETLLINVTEFFRDRDAFDVIRNKVLPDIMGCKADARHKLKIWSAGCATGEEAYSMAILLNETLGNKSDNYEFSIYGTDIDKDSLEKAKAAAYRIETVDGKIADEILDKYFVRNGSLRVKDFVKRSCFFLFHDLVLDRPLKAMDIILCRNVAIYFERALQEKIYLDFYNALNEDGCLFLGKAETLIGPAQENFEVIDKRWNIYKSRPLGDARLRYERNLSRNDCHSHENGNPDSEYLGLDSRVRGNDRSKSRQNRNYSVSN